MAGPIDITDPARLGADEVTTVATEISVPSIGVHLDDRYTSNCQLVPLPGLRPVRAREVDRRASPSTLRTISHIGALRDGGCSRLHDWITGPGVQPEGPPFRTPDFGTRPNGTRERRKAIIRAMRRRLRVAARPPSGRWKAVPGRRRSNAGDEGFGLWPETPPEVESEQEVSGCFEAASATLAR